MSDKETIIRPADRVGTVKEYYLQRKMQEVAAMNRRGLDVVSLGIGGPDKSAPASAISALAASAAEPSHHGYQISKGTDELRGAYAAWYGRKYGVSLDPSSEILPLIGSKEGILHVSMTFLNPGDRVLVPNPGYPTYTAVTNLVGAVAVPYDLTAERGWYPDFEALEQMDLTGVKMMWVNYPHMPTGAPARRDLFEKIIDFGRRHSILIAHDNPYSFILNEEPLSILSVDGARDVAVEMNSLSKSHNMAGWRMGMVASNPTFISWISRVKSNIDSGQFRPMMDGAAVALEEDDAWYAEINRTYSERRLVAEQIMEALGCAFDPVQRGMFLWGRVPDDVPDVEAMVDEILVKARVFITPGFIFGTNGERYIRISLCAPVDRLEEALKRIKEYKNRKI